MPTPTSLPRLLYRYADLAELGIIYSNTHLLRLERAGQFPRRIRLSPSKPVWYADEIHRWVDERAAKRGEASDA